MSTRQVFTIRTGGMGSGKSYDAVRTLIEDFLPHTTGVFCTNLPLYPEKIADHHTRYLRDGQKRDEARQRVIDRIIIIPEDVIKSFCDGDLSPMEYFAERDISGWYIALDEFHNMCGKGHSAERGRTWGAFISEIRHMGAQLEAISQDKTRLRPEILATAARLIHTTPLDEERDPYLHVRLADWIQLRSKITRKYKPVSKRTDYVRDDGKWKPKYTSYFTITPKIYTLYDSFSKPVAGGQAGTQPKEIWETHGWIMFILWFYFNNWYGITSRTLFLVAIIWLLPLGGYAKIVNGFVGIVNEVSLTNAKNIDLTGHRADGNDQEQGSLEVNDSGNKEPINNAPPGQSNNPAPARSQHLQLPKITLMGTSYVLLDNGESLAVGQWMDAGPIWIQCVEINNENRTVSFGNGLVLRLGDAPGVRSHVSDQRPEDPTPPDLPGSLPAPVERSPSPSPRDARRRARHDGGRRPQAF